MFLPSADVFCPPQRTENQACFKRALLFTLALCAMLEGSRGVLRTNESSMTYAAGRVRWGVLRLCVEGGGGIYNNGCRWEGAGEVRSLDCVAAPIFRLVLVRLLYKPTIHSSY